jgi:hypothetical protein
LIGVPDGRPETTAAVGLVAGAVVVAPPVAGVGDVVVAVVPGVVLDLQETITSRIEASTRNCSKRLSVNFKVVLLLRRRTE